MQDSLASRLFIEGILPTAARLTEITTESAANKLIILFAVPANL